MILVDMSISMRTIPIAGSQAYRQLFWNMFRLRVHTYRLLITSNKISITCTADKVYFWERANILSRAFSCK